MKLVSKILLVLVAILITGDAAFAADEASAGGLDGLAAGLAIGVAALGGALGQGKTASSALEGIGRNPGASGSMLVPMILGLALIESLVIYALIVAYWLVG